MYRISLHNIPLYLFICIALPLLIALLLEHWGHYLPCSLCLKQRWAYYISLIILIPTWFISFHLYRYFVISVIGIAFFSNAILAIYHSGVEWLLWQGPTSCSALAQTNPQRTNVLELLSNSKVITCTEPALLVLGLSLTNLNFIVSCVILFLCLRYVTLSYQSYSSSKK